MFLLRGGLTISINYKKNKVKLYEQVYIYYTNIKSVKAIKVKLRIKI